MPEPGLYRGVPFADYLQWPTASKSSLWLMHEKSPAHVMWAMKNPKPATQAMRIGSATHHAVLEPDIFGERYVRGPEGSRATKAVKEAEAAILAERPDAQILKPVEYDLCISLRDAVHAHPKAHRLIDGEAEASATWVDEETGVRCKGRIDMISDKTPTIVDLKTTRDASPRRFPRDFYNLGYHVQAAFYLEGAMRVGVDATHFVIVAVEKDPPFGVALYDVSTEALLAGAEEARRLLRQWAKCEQAGSWPAYSDRVEQLNLPTWATREIEARTDMEG